MRLKTYLCYDSTIFKLFILSFYILSSIIYPVENLLCRKTISSHLEYRSRNAKEIFDIISYYLKIEFSKFLKEILVLSTFLFICMLIISSSILTILYIMREYLGFFMKYLISKSRFIFKKKNSYLS